MLYLYCLLFSFKGEYQYVNVKFENDVQFERLKFQFQGGFSCKEIELIDTSENADKGKPLICRLYPEDVNNIQSIKLFDEDLGIYIKSIRMNLKKPTDTFGRIILYSLEFYGSY